jgi:hypothetical protein
MCFLEDLGGRASVRERSDDAHLENWIQAGDEHERS